MVRLHRLLGDLAIDDKILARVVDAYRRIRNTLRFLLANVSDFDPASDTVPADQLLEIDRYALARASQLQADILGHYEVYEFHPVVAKLQVYCSEDLVRSTSTCSRTASTPPRPRAWPAAAPRPRCTRSPMPCCAGWRRSFRSLQKKHGRCSANPRTIFVEKFWDFGATDAALLDKWDRIRAAREVVNKEIEALRADGKVGASLQAEVTGDRQRRTAASPAQPG